MSNDIEKAVMAHVADHIGLPLGEIKSDDDLFSDLGVDRDDAVELIDSFAEKFEVSTAQFEISRHFGPERPFSFLNFLVRCFSRRKPGVIPLTVGDLILAAEKKQMPLK